jgi:hypothetical protein
MGAQTVVNDCGNAAGAPDSTGAAYGDSSLTVVVRLIESLGSARVALTAVSGLGAGNQSR